MLSLVRQCGSRNTRVLASTVINNACKLKSNNLIIETPLRSIGTMWEGWINNSFNKVDESRVKEVGVDRACAEWILRCGGGVQWTGSKKYLRDYNSLPATGGQKIYSIDMTDSCVMEAAFILLKSLKELQKITICNAKYINDDSIGYLCSYTRDKLTWLQIEQCNNVTDEGLHHLRVMKKLEYLGLSTLYAVDKPKEMLEKLKAALPDCHIEYPPYTTPPPEQDTTETNKID